jgi:hypothetical protein
MGFCDFSHMRDFFDYTGECLLKTSSSAAQPRSALRLLDRALSVLCYRWDEQKGIARHQLTPLSLNRQPHLAISKGKVL